MPNGNPLTVSINFNYNNGNPIWTVDPQSLPVPPGNAPIQWILSGTGATFPTSNGIVFPAPGTGSKNSIQWPGSTPAYQNVNKYTATDQNNLQVGDPPQVFRYNINVLYNNVAQPTYDPDVTNDPPSGPGDELPGDDGSGSPSRD